MDERDGNLTVHSEVYAMLKFSMRRSNPCGGGGGGEGDDDSR